jgi:hypothetical protein
MLLRYTVITLIILSFQKLKAQELYIMTEPASNMPSKSLGIRLTNKLMPMPYDNSYSYRLEPEIMFGINKHLMIHANMYASNMFTGKFKFEGGSLYAKYRFLSFDDIHSHFRMAAFGKISASSNPSYIPHATQHQLNDGTIHQETTPVYSSEIDLDGNNSGAAAGIVATQLLHKLAISAAGSFTSKWKNVSAEKISGFNSGTVNYSISAGYLLFPKTYKNYEQTNVNLYLEVLGSSGFSNKDHYIDVAPGIQFILNSISRIDLAYRTQVTGDMLRYNTTSWLLRYEYTFLNIGSKKAK